MTDFAYMSAAELLEGFRACAFSPREVLDVLAERTERVGPELGAFVTLCLERAGAEADAATARYRRREPAGALDGLPIGVKDMVDTAGVRTTYGSQMFAGHTPQRDADAVARLRGAGAIVVGKTQTHEFAWGISSVNEAMGSARNPWDPSRIAGGSSGGSAVALAAGLVPLAIGTDTGGSIRIPSAFCGTTGFKPSFGTVDTAGVFPLAPSLDHVGPMARNPTDVALLYAVLASGCSAATASVRPHRSEGPLAGVRVGRCEALDGGARSSAVEAALAGIAASIEALGGKLTVVELPEADGVTDTYMAIQRSEALAVHRWAGLYPARASEYGSDVGRWLALASQASPGDLDAACKARERLRRGFDRIFAGVDLLLTAVAPCPPFHIGVETIEVDGVPRTLRELVLGATVAQDLAGLPACTLRAGFDADDCPIGVQLTGRLGDDTAVLAAAASVYAATAQTQQRWPQLPPGARSRAHLGEGRESVLRSGVG